MGKTIQEKVNHSAFHFIDSLGRAGMKFELSRINTVLTRLGSPHRSLPAVHIAGTNGKGSVGAMIAQALQDQGYKVGLYTSPHLIRLHERFQVNGHPISTSKLIRLIQRVRRALGRVRLTQYEFLTAIAFCWLADEKVDVAVIETGLGGRLDATNVLETALLTLITNIDLEHTQWLGSTKEKIAKEKAGILKKGVPLITGASGPALKVILSQARRKNVQWYSSPRSGEARRGKPRGLIYTPPGLPCKQGRNLFSAKSLSLRGQHQIQNASLAFSALHVLSSVMPIELSRARRAIQAARWPGRFEVFRWKGKTIILDGAHNPAAVRALVETLRSEKISSFHLLFGALSDKNIQEMARPLAPKADHVVVVPLPSDRSASPSFVAGLSGWKGKARAAETVTQGWTQIRSFSSTSPILVTGSLYLVGEIRKRLIKKHF